MPCIGLGRSRLSVGDLIGVSAILEFEVRGVGKRALDHDDWRAGGDVVGEVGWRWVTRLFGEAGYPLNLGHPA